MSNSGNSGNKASKASKPSTRSRGIGVGLLKGLAVTAKNFVGSYVDKERLTTVEYPEQRVTPKENFRNVPFLIFDNDPNAGIRCVACKICEQECPPQCIFIELELDEQGQSKKRPKVFDIDFTVCMNCGICAEACPFDAIKMDSTYELASTDRFAGQLADKTRLLKSNEYYHQIKPTEAAAVDARLAAKKKPPAKPAAPAAAATPAATSPTTTTAAATTTTTTTTTTPTTTAPAAAAAKPAEPQKPVEAKAAEPAAAATPKADEAKPADAGKATT